LRQISRKGKNVVPTSAGNIFYEHAKRILDSYRVMENEIYHLVCKMKGPLSIGASATAATYLLPQVFYDFSRIYQEARLNLSVSNTENIINELHHGKIDLGIVPWSRSRQSRMTRSSSDFKNTPTDLLNINPSRALKKDNFLFLI
jgi:DNA-binding transcriptional LysR family regulator